MSRPANTDELRSSKAWRELDRPDASNDLRAWMRRHLDALLVAQYATETVYVRAHFLARFAAWCEERAIQRPEEVTRAVLERFQRHLHGYRKRSGAPLTAEWQLAFLLGLQSFFRWLVQRGHLPFNPAADLLLPKVPLRRLPAPLSEAEIETMFAQLDPAVPIELRDRALWEVAYSTGLRRFELVKLRLKDIDRARGTVFVHQGKHRKDRVVPIGERALAWLDKYLDALRGAWVRDPAEDRVFLNPDGSVPTVKALSHRASALIKRAGIARPGACHLFRHAMATHMLEHGADVRYVQEILGHEKLTSTQIYTHVSIAKLKAIHTATHPKARLARRRDMARDAGDASREGEPDAEAAAAPLSAARSSGRRDTSR